MVVHRHRQPCGRALPRVDADPRVGHPADVTARSCIGRCLSGGHITSVRAVPRGHLRDHVHGQKHQTADAYDDDNPSRHRAWGKDLTEDQHGHDLATDDAVGSRVGRRSMGTFAAGSLPQPRVVPGSYGPWSIVRARRRGHGDRDVTGRSAPLGEATQPGTRPDPASAARSQPRPLATAVEPSRVRALLSLAGRTCHAPTSVKPSGRTSARQRA